MSWASGEAFSDGVRDLVVWSDAQERWDGAIEGVRVGAML